MNKLTLMNLILSDKNLVTELDKHLVSLGFRYFGQLTPNYVIV